MKKDRLALVKIQGQIERLEKLFEDWMQKKISKEKFAAESVIELLKLKKGTSSLISKAIWSE